MRSYSVYLLSIKGRSLHVGMAANFERRFRWHLVNLKKGTHSNSDLQKAYIQHQGLDGIVLQAFKNKAKAMDFELKMRDSYGVKSVRGGGAITRA